MKLKLKRIVAGLIDFLIIISIIIIFEVVNIKNEMLDIILMSLEAIFMFFIIPRKDCLFGYESIGKKIMKLGIYKDNKRVTDKDILRKRTYYALIALPFNMFYILKNNKCIGDEEYNTEVKEILPNEMIVEDFKNLKHAKKKSIFLGFIIDIIIILIFLVLLIIFSYYIKWTVTVYSLILSISISVIWGILVNSLLAKNTIGQKIANNIKNGNMKIEILNKIKEVRILFKKAPIPMLAGTVQLLLILFVIIFLEDRILFKMIFSLVLVLPSICFFSYANTISKYKKGKILANIIFPIIVIIPYLFYVIISIFFIGFIAVENPDTKLSQYKQCLDYFPKEIPDNYKEAKYYHSYPFLQAGEETMLYLKIDEDYINYYRKKYQDKTVRLHKDASDPYEDRYQDFVSITKDFDLYLLDSSCDDSGYCNHGREEYILINEDTNEILFYYSAW